MSPEAPIRLMRMGRSKSKPFNLKWSDGNKKLNKPNGGVYRIIGFGLPADYNMASSNGETLNTCPGALACRGVCYAKQGLYIKKPEIGRAHV